MEEKKEEEKKEEEKKENIFQELMEKESTERFTKPWSKLDKGTKLNRIQLFIKMEKANKSLNNLQEEQLRKLLISYLEMGGLNKKSTITYDSTNKEITEIKNLNFNKENNRYYFDNIEKKSEKKSKSKSKSNIDRHFKKTN